MDIFSDYSNDAKAITHKYTIQTPVEAQKLAKYLGLQSPNATAVESGLFELFMNAIEHGNLNIGSSRKTELLANDQYVEEVQSKLEHDDYKERKVFIVVEYHGDQIYYTVTDEGAGFDHQKFTDLEITSIKGLHGRGIVIAKDLSFQHLQYNDAGNSVKATFQKTTASKLSREVA